MNLGLQLTELLSSHNLHDSHSSQDSYSSHARLTTVQINKEWYNCQILIYCCFVGYWRIGLWAGHAVLLAGGIWQFGRTGDAAQESSVLQGEREGGRRRQELRDRANTEKRKKGTW